jgi:hypothetical protein
MYLLQKNKRDGTGNWHDEKVFITEPAALEAFVKVSAANRTCAWRVVLILTMAL